MDGCIPELGELQRLHTFLEASHSARGNVSLSTNRLADWIANLCDSMKGKLTPVPSQLARKRKRTDRTSFAHPVTQSALRYEVLRVNSHFHGLNNVMHYDVTWSEPGSANTREPYSSLHHLDVLMEYERRCEACPDSKDFYKALYLCQRNKERDAMLSEDDTDSEMTETEPASQQSVASTSQSDLFIPTLTPSSQEQSDWVDYLEAGTWMKEGLYWVRDEEMTQPPLAPLVEPSEIVTPFIGPTLDWRSL
jgi:hypothetical protein